MDTHYKEKRFMSKTDEITQVIDMAIYLHSSGTGCSSAVRAL
jgi:hypothetical protein